MTAQAPDFDAEREVDLARWRGALAARWWLVAAGLAAGVVVGALYSLSGGQVYKAETLLSLGQPFSPDGNSPIASFLTTPQAVNEIVASESALATAAAKAGIPIGSLRHHVSVSTVSPGTGASAARGTPLVKLAVQLGKPKRAEDAANELTRIVVADTTQKYVKTKIATFNLKLKNYRSQLATVGPRLTQLQQVIGSAGSGLTAVDKLVLVSQADNAEQRYSILLDQIATTQSQLALARNVESAKVIEPARAVKTTARSRRNSVLVGALIGIILGAIAAVVADSRMPRSRPA